MLLAPGVHACVSAGLLTVVPQLLLSVQVRVWVLATHVLHPVQDHDSVQMVLTQRVAHVLGLVHWSIVVALLSSHSVSLVQATVQGMLTHDALHVSGLLHVSVVVVLASSQSVSRIQVTLAIWLSPQQ